MSAKLKTKIQRLESDIDWLRAALKCYADKQNYILANGVYAPIIWVDNEPRLDYGHIARVALGEKP